MDTNRFSFIKVFGERNTGTNFLNNLLKANVLDVEVLDHGSNEEVDAALRDFPPEHHPFVDERMRDYLRSREFNENFGFKHALVERSALERSPRFSETVFIFITRHPCYFIKALHRRPYSIVPPPNKDGTVDHFLRQKIVMHSRETAGYPIAGSPMELWSLKTKGLLKAHEEIEGSILVRYEDLVADPGALLAELRRRGVTTTDAVNIPQESTKGDPLTFRDYQRIASDYRPEKDFTAEELSTIRSKIDMNLCAVLKYEF